ncbi:MAG: type II toxin-antitoxin system prevent-host-death family antitoxin [bacterium]|nr:type II toxin-antitoxin system prevent-host-death family antitoxin [bacterium]
MMKTASVGDVQKSFSKILNSIKSGEEIIITRRDEPIGRLTALGPKTDIDWPDFYFEAIEAGGKSVSEIVLEDREDRF